MDIIILCLALGIFGETTYLTLANKGKGAIRPHERKIFIDTSVLMDGRITDLAKTGFIGGELLIPRSVIRELQMLADGKDSDKRARARLGIDTANELERVQNCNVEIFEDELDRTPVDERLIQLAKQYKGAIMTNDYNLNKVCKTEKITVLNINDLSLVLRAEYLPGERLKIKIRQEGNNPKQGVGHLPDGTMVVVDNASNKVGQEVEVEFVRHLQTSAGRMAFAKLAPANNKRARK